MQVFPILFLTVFFVFNTSCSKKEVSMANVQFHIDQSVLGNSEYSSKVAQPSDEYDDNWGQPDPESLAEIDCFAVVIHGAEPELSHSVCEFADSKKFAFGPRAGFYPVGKSGKMKVLAGLNRTFYLIGMSSEDKQCPTDFEQSPDIDGKSYSNPYVIGKTTVDLIRGENVVEIMLRESFDSSNKIEDCDFFSKDEPANLVITETMPYDFGNVVNNQTVSHQLTLKNIGHYPASAITNRQNFPLSFSYKGGSYPGKNGTCGETLEPNEECTIEVDFAPTGEGNYSEESLMTYYDGFTSKSLTIALKGSGATPALLELDLSVSAGLNFGSNIQGWTENRLFRLTNSGGTTATNIAAQGLSTNSYSYTGGAFPGVGQDCKDTLQPGESCDFNVDFIANYATNDDAIVINYNNGFESSTLNLAVEGMGLPPAVLVITRVGSDFGQITLGETKNVTFNVQNNGGVSAQSVIFPDLISPFSYKGNTCPPTISAGLSCTIEIKYQPITTGPSDDEIVINYQNGQGTDVVYYDIQGGANDD